MLNFVAIRKGIITIPGTSVTTARKSAASVTKNDSVLWITGGMDENFNRLSSSEFVLFSTNNPGSPTRS